eukprot:TRINITY_DN34575_c0_g1_i1.p1 TRINITY_DN34575_c0_g1~~TRINITY_DN34575_c0_g1_i1.p1  ORF type:complete len:256 (+),score=26.71 TRINITY_DN34575_c0_g1_i1:50-817(+)
MMLRTEASKACCKIRKRLVAVRFYQRSGNMYPEPGSERAAVPESGFSRLGHMKTSEIHNRPTGWYSKHDPDSGNKITDSLTGDSSVLKLTPEAVTAQPEYLLSTENRAWLQVRRASQVHICRGCGYGYPKQLKECPSCKRLQVGAFRLGKTWACGVCLYVNEVNVNSNRRGTCANCRASKTKALFGTFDVNNSWICKPCKTIVPSRDSLCPTCNRPKLASTEFDPMAPQGTWYCSKCHVRNFKNNNKCNSCGYWK